MSMGHVKTLILSENPKVAEYAQIIRGENAEVEIKKSEDIKRGPVDWSAYQVLFIDIDHFSEDPCGYSLEIRKSLRDLPFQIILLSDKSRLDYEKIIRCGGDDFLTYPVEKEELIARFKAAEIRLHHQRGLLEEKEYIEEAYNKMIEINKELEDSNRELEHIARYDYLSGLLNRMNLYALMEKEIERAVRHETSLSGIMLDIDHFKPINDNYGHQVGDQVIRELGKRLLSTLRKYDHAGRYGGEEFFVVLPNTDLNGAKNIAERFRTTLDTEKMIVGEQEFSVTASLGVAQYRHGESREAWITRADRAMYMAKEMGRNRVATEG